MRGFGGFKRVCGVWLVLGFSVFFLGVVGRFGDFRGLRALGWFRGFSSFWGVWGLEWF